MVWIPSWKDFCTLRHRRLSDLVSTSAHSKRWVKSWSCVCPRKCLRDNLCRFILCQERLPQLWSLLLHFPLCPHFWGKSLHTYNS